MQSNSNVSEQFHYLTGTVAPHTTYRTKFGEVMVIYREISLFKSCCFAYKEYCFAERRNLLETTLHKLYLTKKTKNKN